MTNRIAEIRTKIADSLTDWAQVRSEGNVCYATFYMDGNGLSCFELDFANVEDASAVFEQLDADCKFLDLGNGLCFSYSVYRPVDRQVVVTTALKGLI